MMERPEDVNANEPDLNELGHPDYMWSDQPVETYRGWHIYEVIDREDKVIGYAIEEDLPEVEEQAPIERLEFDATLEAAKKRIDDLAEVHDTVHKLIDE